MIRRTAAALLLLIFSAAAKAQAPLPFTLKQVGRGVYAAIDGPDHKSGANSGFVIGDDGVVVIDSFFYPDATRALIAEIRRLTDKPIRYVVNTHYHVDHTGGDAVLKEAGATIIAHRNVRAWVRPENIHLLGDRITPEMKAQIEQLPLPDVTTTTGLSIWLGSREVVVRPVLGHTGGDLDVYVPDSNVLFTGDLLWRKIPPNLIDGSVKEWTATDADFIALPDAAQMTFVPGHGDIANLADVKDFRQYLLDLRKLVAEGRKAGLKADALTAFVEPKLKSLHPDWTISDRSAAAEVRYMNDELAGTKRRPVPMAQ
jgi:glyoxylase-like metal-dependent hydrolase (beta-lactamase superfamily II)